MSGPQCLVSLDNGQQCRNSAHWVVAGKPICGKHANMIRNGRALRMDGAWVNGITQQRPTIERASKEQAA